LVVLQQIHEQLVEKLELLVQQVQLVPEQLVPLQLEQALMVQPLVVAL
jgi:hypothetical protein